MSEESYRRVPGHVHLEVPLRLIHPLFARPSGALRSLAVPLRIKACRLVSMAVNARFLGLAGPVRVGGILILATSKAPSLPSRMYQVQTNRGEAKGHAGLNILDAMDGLLSFPGIIR